VFLKPLDFRPYKISAGNQPFLIVRKLLEEDIAQLKNQNNFPVWKSGLEPQQLAKFRTCQTIDAPSPTDKTPSLSQLCFQSVVENFSIVYHSSQLKILPEEMKSEFITALGLDSRNLLTDKVFQDLVSSHTRTLNLQKCRSLTDSSFVYASKHCRNLEYLNVNECTISEMALQRILRTCSSLTHLDMSDRYWHDSTFIQVSKCKNLVHLSTTTSDQTHLNRILLFCKNLRYLHLLEPPEDSIQYCNRLYELSFKYCYASGKDEFWKAIADKCVNLKILDMQMRWIGKDDIQSFEANIKRMKDLKVLKIRKEVADLLSVEFLAEMFLVIQIVPSDVKYW